MNGGIYTAGPLYRPDPGAPLRDYRPRDAPALPAARNAARADRTAPDARAGRRLPRRSGVCAHDHPAATRACRQGDSSGRTGQGQAQGPRGCREHDAALPDPAHHQAHQGQAWVGERRATDRPGARAPGLQGRRQPAPPLPVDRADRPAALGGRHPARVLLGPVQSRRRAARGGLGPEHQPGSLTFWITGTLRADRERWMSTQELAAAIAIAATTLDAPTPAVISTRLSPLLRSGRLEKRPREGAKHGHGSTMEYRLTTAF